MDTWLKVKLDKVDSIFTTINNFSESYYEGRLVNGYDTGLTERHWNRSRQIRVDGQVYNLGLMVDIRLKSNHAMVRLQATLRDINDCFCAITIDLSNKNWPEFALTVRDSFHYLCGRQIETAKSNLVNSL